MERHEMDTRLQGDDPGNWGHSMANMRELLLPLLDAAGVETIAEVGAYAGDLTEVLVEWARGAGAKVIAIDPLPQPELVERSRRLEELELIEQTSVDALRDLPTPDAVVIDGDHNYHTVSEELRWIGERARSVEMPLLLFHDVLWPHGRRDAYYAPERVPEEYQEGMAEGVGVFPGEPGMTSGGLPYKWAAKQEGGERNGVLTAVEDFVEGHENLRLAILPMFFGLGVVWDRRASWADAVAELVDPFDANPILARLERNRVFQLASHHRVSTEKGSIEWRLAAVEEKQRKQEDLLRELLRSRTFAATDRVTSLRRGGGELSMREHIRKAISDD